MSDNSLMNIGDLAKPATALIEKVADATGILYEPTRIKRRAKAEAKAEKIQAEAKIEITDIHRRAAQRWIEEETQRQESIENTITKAVPQLNEDADPHAIEDDWIINFFDKSRLVTDDKVQDLWASILAGEANRAGSYSPKTLATIADMDQKVANLFDTFCSLCIVNLEDTTALRQSSSNNKMRDARVPIITGIMTFSGNFQQGSGEFAQKAEAIYEKYGFGIDEFQLLVELGLIQDVNTHTEYLTFFYNDSFWGIMKLPFSDGMSQPTRISGYSLSLVGKELFHITKRSNPRGHLKLLIDFLEQCYKVEIDRVFF